MRTEARSRATNPLASSMCLTLAAALLGAGGCIFVSGDIDPFGRRPRPLQENVVSGHGKAKILLVDLSGAIRSEEESGSLGLRSRESTVARVEAELDRAAEDDQIGALVLRVNSPGGTVTASDVVYERLRRFRAERQVPIVAQLMDLATSGGYYVALAADDIVATPTTVTGSIGVIFTSVSLEGLLHKIGVRNQTVATGAMKDIGSPLRTMSADERELLEALLSDMQERFLGLVQERRPHLTEEMRVQMADGRVLSARQALAGGLVDRIGYLDDALHVARARAGLAEARVVMYRRPSEYAETVYSRSAPAAPEVNLLRLDVPHLPPTPQFLYLWAP